MIVVNDCARARSACGIDTKCPTPRREDPTVSDFLGYNLVGGNVKTRDIRRPFGPRCGGLSAAR